MINEFKEQKDTNKYLNKFKNNTDKQPNKIRKAMQNMNQQFNKDIQFLKKKVEILEMKNSISTIKKLS
jgi:polyhydroxyalkanoate synthesis regulator phasin